MQERWKLITIVHKEISLLNIEILQVEEAVDVTEECVERKKSVLKNRLYGLLCEREKEGSWKDFLDNILLDLTVIPEEEQSYEYLMLVTKLTACKFLAYEYYRKTIFECMKLIDRIDVL